MRMTVPCFSVLPITLAPAREALRFNQHLKT
jgi:hypothetical protein